jgi:hypothetical protein
MVTGNMSERKDALTELRELAGKVGAELEQMEREGDYSVHAEPIRRAYRRILQTITAFEEELRPLAGDAEGTEIRERTAQDEGVARIERIIISA